MSEFSAEEVRVLGVLMEKQLTTPEYYPLTPNAIRTASNQKSNRSPVVEYDEDLVQDTLQQLRKKQMLVVVSGSGSRVRKYEHRMREVFFLNQREMAVLSVLMLRGPQTIGEIRSRTERMADFSTLTEVEEVLKDLSADTRKPLPQVMQLPVWPGQKEPRFIHLMSGQPDIEKLQEETTMIMPQAAAAGASRLTLLEEKVESLTAELESLKEQFATFKEQFE